MKILSLLLTTLVISLCSFAQEKITTPYGNNKEAGNYIRVNGMNMYYETYGSGKPLIFLHGNGGSIYGARQKIEYFKNYFKVIAIDSRGHGKTIDTTSKTLTYTQMAYDTKVLLDSLNIDSAYISGQSDGGILGLLIAIHYPSKVSKLITYGANLFPGKKAIVDELDQLVRDTLKATKNLDLKRKYSMLVYQPHISDKELRTIKCQVLVMTGDRDAIKLEHSLEIFYNIENSNLFVMPGATHFGSVEKPNLYNELALDFFTKPFSKLSTVELFTGKRK